MQYSSILGLSPLHLACRQHNPLPEYQPLCLTVAHRLIDAGANVDAEDSQVCILLIAVHVRASHVH